MEIELDLEFVQKIMELMNNEVFLMGLSILAAISGWVESEVLEKWPKFNELSSRNKRLVAMVVIPLLLTLPFGLILWGLMGEFTIFLYSIGLGFMVAYFGQIKHTQKLSKTPTMGDMVFVSKEAISNMLIAIKDGDLTTEEVKNALKDISSDLLGDNYGK